MPEPRQVSEIALEFLLGFVNAGGADDETEATRWLQFGEDVTKPAALVIVGDLAGHAHAVEARHEHEIPAGDADVGA